MSNRLSDYDFELPPELIAQEPASPRDHSRLLLLKRGTGEISHHRFYDLPKLLRNGDLMIANNTRVIKARMLGQRVLPDGTLGGKVEFVMLEPKAEWTWEGLFHASAKYVRGLKFSIPTPDGRGLIGELVSGSAESAHGTVIARFDRDPLAADAGELPLPHYIDRPADVADAEKYQTIYSSQPGSAAAPTAGLHFTSLVHEGLRGAGVTWREITLHVGLGTFRPVKTEDLSAHQMHEERYEISSQVCADVARARAEKRRVIAVGTTSVRSLESAVEPEGSLRAGSGRTSLFVRPGHFDFRVIDGLLTNFHLPRSTLLMLVSAFAGRENVLRAYAEAVRERYRFFSYGDAMLIID